MRRMKDGKATGEDGIPSEVWKYGGEELVGSLWKICNKAWKGEEWPREWREGVVIPIIKKGEGLTVEQYRRVTLTQTAYKVYTAVLAERLKGEIEDRKILPSSQAGFRKIWRTIDNIYVLNYLINRQIEEGENSFVFHGHESSVSFGR